MVRSSFQRMPFLPADQQDLLRPLVHQHFFEDFIEVQAFVWRGLLVPFERAGIDIQCNRGVAEKLVADAARAGLGLAGAPIGQLELGIIGARDPGIGAGALAVGHVPQLSPPGSPV